MGRTRYQPTAAITDHVLTRDGHRCTRPGCAHTARDLDHALAWDTGGTTAAANLHPVCRGCHTAKHTGGWTVSVIRDGTTIWRTPHGHQTRTAPADLRPEDRMTRPPDPVSRWLHHLTHDLHHAQALAQAATRRPNPGRPDPRSPDPRSPDPRSPDHRSPDPAAPTPQPRPPQPRPRSPDPRSPAAGPHARQPPDPAADPEDLDPPPF